MKKNILFVLLAGLLAGVNAQNITFLTPDVNLYGPNYKTEYQGNVGIANNSTDPNDTTFSWRFINYAKPTGWEIDLCDPFECKFNVNVSTTFSFDLVTGKSGGFYAKYHPNSIGGNGALTVVVTSILNPSNADTVEINLNAWNTAVKEVSALKSVSFYPNPVKDQLTFKFQTAQTINVDIYNVLGMKVKTFAHDGSLTQVGLTDLQNGVYFLRFTEAGKSYTKQFIKAQ
jgi:hypothetical protein